eukprot:ANDGO_03642.mRNA.1 WD repeat-containing protein 3 homolog
MPQSYLRYTLQTERGAIYGGNTRLVSHGQLLVSPAQSQVLVYRGSSLLHRIVPGPTSSSVLTYSNGGGAIYTSFDPKMNVSALASSTPRDLIAIGRENGRVDIVHLARGLECTLIGHHSRVTALSFSTDGLSLTSASADGVVCVWDIPSQAKVRTWEAHSNVITNICLFQDFTITCSLDHLVRIWDQTGACIDTLTELSHPIWNCAVHAGRAVLVVSAVGMDLAVYDLSGLADTGKSRFLGLMKAAQLRGNVTILEFSTDGEYLLANDGSRIAFVWKVVVEEDQIKSKKKKLEKKKKEKATKQQQKGSAEEKNAGDDGELANENEDEDEDEDENEALLYFSLRGTLALDKKARSVQFSRSESVPVSSKDKKKSSKKNNETNATMYKVSIGYANNKIDVCSVAVDSLPQVAAAEAPIERLGHRSDVRAIAFSNESTFVISTDSSNIMVWAFPSFSVSSVVELPDNAYPLSLVVLKGDRYAAIGTKEGDILLLDLNTLEFTDRVAAHTGSVWSLAVDVPSSKDAVIVSGSADKTVKFWNPMIRAGKLTLEESQELRLEDDVLAVKLTSKFVIAATLDHQARVFYRDSLKFFLAMYGHSLPILSLDVTDDESLLITGSADKTVRIWGLDYGDCHRVLKKAHDDSVLQVVTIPRTHFAVTAGKDGRVIAWDCDRFERIQYMSAGCAFVWALDVSHDGLHVIAAGSDRVIRRFEKEKEEIIFPQEEEEKERNIAIDEEMKSQKKQGVVAVEAYSIAEWFETEIEQAEKNESPVYEVVLRGLYEMKFVQDQPEPGVPASLLQSVIAMLSSDTVHVFISALWTTLDDSTFAHRHSQIIQVLLTIIKQHHGTMLAKRDRSVLRSEAELFKVQSMLQRQKDLLGVNLAALDSLRRRMEDQNKDWVFLDVTKYRSTTDRASAAAVAPSAKRPKKSDL